MYEFMLRISGEQIDGSEFSGLGTQCATLCEHVAALVPDCEWFAADFDAFMVLPEHVVQKVPHHIGSIAELRALVKPIDRLLWGVMLAVPHAHMPVAWTREYWADDGPPETLDGAVVEVRSFGGHYFEVYATDLNLLHTLGPRFDCAVGHWQDPTRKP